MIEVVVATVYRCDPLMCLATGAPQLEHVDLPRLVVPAWVPRDRLAPEAMDVARHLGAEVRIRELHLVRPYMDVGDV